MHRSLAPSLIRSFLAAILASGCSIVVLGCGGAPATKPGAAESTPRAARGGAAPRPESTVELSVEPGAERVEERPSTTSPTTGGSILLVLDDYSRRETRRYQLDPANKSVSVVTHRIGSPGVQSTGPTTIDLRGASSSGEVFELFERDFGWFAAPLFGEHLGATRIDLGVQPVPNGAVAGDFHCIEWVLPSSSNARRTRWYLDASGRPVAVAGFSDDGSEMVEVLRGDGVLETGEMRSPIRLFTENGLELELTELREGR
ncbi:MAG: hypothetical protein AAF196_02455 [Planctomycetota bacterium]